MLEGAGYTLPSAVVASGMLKVDDKKFSKSRGIVVWVKDDYLDKGLHPDLLRYYLASYTSHNKEVNFSWRIFADKVNTELVGAFGNFINRALTFTYKNYDGKVPSGEIDPEAMARIVEALTDARTSLEEYEFKKLTDGIMTLADFGNTYFQSREPWKLVRADKAKAGSVLRTCLQIAKAMIILMEPAMPGKMQSAWSQLGMKGTVGEVLFDEAMAPIPEGHDLGKPEILFTKMDDSKVKELEEIFKKRIEQADVRGKKELAAGGDEKPKTLSFDQLQAVDLRIGEITAAEPIKGSSKLLRLKVNLGAETRQVVAGIALAYEPEDLVGTQVVVVANLEPAKLFGIESQAMLLAADVKGKAVLLRPSEKVDVGTKVR